MTERYTDDEKAEAVKKFLEMKAAGKAISEIEKEMGISNTALYAWVKRAKEGSRVIKRATMLPSAPMQKTVNGKFPPELRQKAEQMIAAGGGLTDIARQLGVKAATVGYWKKTMDAKGRPRVAASAAVQPAPMKQVNGIGSGGGITDALIYLRHAEREIMDMVRDGKIARPDQAHLLTLLALGALQKVINS